jgi:hypothetical protein
MAWVPESKWEKSWCNLASNEDDWAGSIVGGVPFGVTIWGEEDVGGRAIVWDMRGRVPDTGAG